MTYRAAAVTQRDGSKLQYSNCRMASISTGLDFHTAGVEVTTGAVMRSVQDDQDGGTDSGDAVQAWQRGWKEQLIVRDGSPWSAVIADLDAGRLVHLDVWHATVGGPCLSGSGAYGHTMAVAPERSGARWLVADPWCKPARWEWVDETKLRQGAEAWGRKVYQLASSYQYDTTGPFATLGLEYESIRDRVRRELVQRAVHELMSAYYPTAPSAEPLPAVDTGGSIPVLYTVTASAGGADDMAIQAAQGLTSGYVCELASGLDFYADADLKQRLGEMTAKAVVPYVGSAIGEAPAAGSRAVLVRTGTAYADKEPRPTVVYVAAQYCTPAVVTTEPPADIDARDEEWREWLLAGSPGSEG